MVDLRQAKINKPKNSTGSFDVFNVIDEDVELPLEGEISQETISSVNTFDPENLDVSYFGFADKETQTEYFQKALEGFNVSELSVLETNAGRGDSEKILDYGYYVGYDFRHLFSNYVITGPLSDLECNQDIDLVFHSLTLQNSNAWGMTGFDLDPYELFKYLLTDWELISDCRVKWSLFTVGVHSENDIELVKDMVYWAISMNYNFAVDYFTDNRILKFIITH